MNLYKFAPFTPFIASAVRAALISWGSMQFKEADEASTQISSAIVVILGVVWGQYSAHWKFQQQSKQPTESKNENGN